MGRILHFDCFAGAAGDMVLGALIDAGLPLEALEAQLTGLMMPGWRMEARQVRRAGLSATKFSLLPPPQAAASGIAAGRPDAHRTVAEVMALVEKSALSDTAKNRVRDLFRRLAEIEARVHQIPVEQVHLHEVGALDSIIDIAGVVAGLEWFGVDRITSSPLNVGGGTVQTAHGVLPVPAPATAELLRGVPVYSSGPDGERVTPTGALLVAGHAAAFGALPAMRVAQTGYGAGDRDTPGLPNVVRVLIGEPWAGANAERVLVLECEVDDMNPQLFGSLMDRLFAAGAVEVFFTSVQMKKNRPGTLITVLAPPELRETLADVLFRETTTIGLRYREMDRLCLDRETRVVDTPLGPIRFKVACRDGVVMNAGPEFDECVRVAAACGVPVKEVFLVAQRAFGLHRQV